MKITQYCRVIMRQECMRNHAVSLNAAQRQGCVRQSPPPPVYDAAAHTARSCLAILGRTAREGLPWWLRCKESACSAGAAGDRGSIPGLGRFPKGGYGNPLRFSCLENPMDRGAWWAPWGRKELDMTEQPTQQQQQSM